jgi:sulfate permease, SulP family
MGTVWRRFLRFNQVWDDRFEDLKPDTWLSTTYRDFSAGLIVAMTAIPMAMGFAIASGLRPEQGIIAGALACIVGRTWGGSKYQVYGPTAAFIPVLAALMLKYGETNGGTFDQAHGFLVLCSIVSGVVLLVMGLTGLGKYAKLVPNSIIVGFTVGIAVAIAMSNAGEALGLRTEVKGSLFAKASTIWTHLDEFNGYALFLALLTLFATRSLLKISIFIPAPLLSLGVGTLLAATVFRGRGITVLTDRYPDGIPTNYIVFTPPWLPELTAGVLFDIGYFVLAIVFVSAVESLLCSSMADRLADNRGTPFNPDKEFWGQGMVQIITPLVNGFPCTGALARTATSIKAGAVTPLAGYFKGVLKLIMVYYMAGLLALVPMACIGGILLWVASNMVKPSEIREVWKHSRFHAALMIYTAVMVPVTDFLTGVLSALILYAVLYRFFDKPPATKADDAPAGAKPAVVSSAAINNPQVVPLEIKSAEGPAVQSP